ncbi:hypothetical protein [Paenibacillus sp. CF384]|uniref:hypothetical protein n=1 Tax=Paenibacillus sp. CF384 TaxID=1884382 RepID=UPI00089659EB|nr:hypothetical protein [Paenibacillus sp. CF384]SDX06448.1 hypothetical protein SAMN05518855_1008123 [Paenibacillus sp. CF384]
MRSKIIFSIIAVILLVSVLSVVYYKTNYKILDEAISESNVPIDEIFHTTDYKGYTIIFYGNDDTLSVGLIEKTPLGYRWGFGAGSKMFNEDNQILTRMFSNLQPREIKADDELVSLTFGVIYEDAIEKIKIKYKDQSIADATIIETNKGRIWYCFSSTPVNYDPDVTRIYKNGTEILGWY